MARQNNYQIRNRLVLYLDTSLSLFPGVLTSLLFVLAVRTPKFRSTKGLSFPQPTSHNKALSIPLSLSLSLSTPVTGLMSTSTFTLGMAEFSYSLLIELIILSAYSVFLYLSRFTRLMVIIIRTLDICTPLVYLATFNLAYISAADSPFSAYAFYFAIFFLPLRVNTLLREKLSRLGQVRRPQGVERFGAMSIRYGAPIILMIITFLGGFPKILVREDMAKLINETEYKNTFISNPFVVRPVLVQFITGITLVLPKRVTHSLWSALVMSVFVYALFLVEIGYLHPPSVGKAGSTGFIRDNIVDYIMHEWSGRWLVAFSVAWSSYVAIFNPFWQVGRISKHEERQDEEAGDPARDQDGLENQKEVDITSSENPIPSA